MHEITELIKALAWPATTLVIFLILRGELQRFTKNVADRIQSANSISIGPRGVELKGVVKSRRCCRRYNPEKLASRVLSAA